MSETTVTFELDGVVVSFKKLTDAELVTVHDWNSRYVDPIPYSLQFQPDSDAIMTVEVHP